MRIALAILLLCLTAVHYLALRAARMDFVQLLAVRSYHDWNCNFFNYRYFM